MSNDILTARHRFVAPIEGVEWRQSGAGNGTMTVAGHAAVFNRLSHDLGGFREKIASGAFSRVLDGNPDVHLLWDHDTALVLARTTNKTLDLREDPKGLHFWGRVAPTSYAEDLRVLMERGDIDQASFAFTVPEDGDEWRVKDDEVTRTIRMVDGLYDATITARGAYPQTDAGLRSLMLAAVETGRLEGLSRAKLEELTGERQFIPVAITTSFPAADEPGDSDAAQDDPVDATEQPETRTDAVPGEAQDAPDDPVVTEEPKPTTDLLADLKTETHEAVRAMRERHLLTMKGLLRNENHNPDRGGQTAPR